MGGPGPGMPGASDLTLNGLPTEAMQCCRLVASCTCSCVALWIVSGCSDASLVRCKGEGVQTLMCRLAACSYSRCKTGNPFAPSSALCSMFCHDLGLAAHTHRFALTRRFELCYNATAGLSSLLSRRTHDLFCPALLQRCLSPALALHFVWWS